MPKKHDATPIVFIALRNHIVVLYSIAMPGNYVFLWQCLVFPDSLVVVVEISELQGLLHVDEKG